MLIDIILTALTSKRENHLHRIRHQLFLCTFWLDIIIYLVMLRDK